MTTYVNGVPDDNASTKVMIGGQLGGTVASPKVIGITTTDPATLTIGAITDGQYLLRSGSTITGGSPSGGSGTAFSFFAG